MHNSKWRQDRKHSVFYNFMEKTSRFIRQKAVLAHWRGKMTEQIIIVLLLAIVNLAIVAMNAMITMFGVKFYTEYVKDKLQDNRKRT